MKKLILMCGIPGSGKSTFVKSVMTSKDFYISRDEIRYEKISKSDDYFKYENEVFESFIDQITSALLWNEDGIVYADATHLNKKSRSKVINRVKNYANEIDVIFLKTPLEICLERNKKRKGLERVPSNTIIDMYHRFEFPSANENINYVHIVKDGIICKTINFKKERKNEK